jgi:membrane-associated phospholipid phosphatase
LVPPYCLLLVGTSVLHALVVPVWDVSSHVLYAVVPTAYLLAVDRRFAVLAAVPPALVWSRVSLGAHTLAEALGGFALGLLIAVAALRRRWIGTEKRRRG